jgi:hypothetical protein
MLWLDYLQAVDWAMLGKTVLGAGIGTGVVQGALRSTASAAAALPKLGT